MEEEKKVIQVLIVIVILVLCIFIGLIILSAILPYKPSNKILCITNIHILGMCSQAYHQDDGVWPNKNNWCDLLKPYLEDEKRNVFQCPADKIGPCSYAMNENIPVDANELPEDLVVLFESAPGWNWIGGAGDVVTNRHDKPGANIAFADGTVKFVPAGEIPKLRWTVDKSVERQ